MNDSEHSNLTIAEESLPVASKFDFQALDASYSRTLTIESIAVWLLIVLVALIINYIKGNLVWLTGQWWFYLASIVPIVISFILSPMITNARGVALREMDIHYKSGILWRKTVSLPFNRVQHVELENGPLERAFGLTSLNIYTAGGGSADMKIPGLSPDRASTIRAYVIERAGSELIDSES